MVGKDLQQTRVVDAMLLAKVVLVKFQSASIHPSGILTAQELSHAPLTAQNRPTRAALDLAESDGIVSAGGTV
jgi:hypothetical protein